MATTNQLNSSLDELPLNTTGEPTDQLAPEDDLDETDLDEDDLDDDTSTDETEPDADDAEFDEAPLDDDEDLDEDEVNRLFPGENNYTADEPEADDEEPYEGIRKEDEEEGLVDDNMTGMPVVPSPS